MGEDRQYRVVARGLLLVCRPEAARIAKPVVGEVADSRGRRLDALSIHQCGRRDRMGQMEFSDPGRTVALVDLEVLGHVRAVGAGRDEAVVSAAARSTPIAR
jgi:hypothetical protein